MSRVLLRDGDQCPFSGALSVLWFSRLFGLGRCQSLHPEVKPLKLAVKHRRIVQPKYLNITNNKTNVELHLSYGAHLAAFSLLKSFIMLNSVCHWCLCCSISEMEAFRDAVYLTVPWSALGPT